MSDDAMTPAGGPPARPLTNRATADLAVNPLRMVPKPYRPAVNWFWLMNQHLLPSATPLAARVKLWVERYGVTPGELNEAFAAMTRPERAANHKFAGDLLADLAAEVDKAVKWRKAQEAQAERKLSAVPDPEKAAALEKLRGEIGRMD